MTKRIRLLTSSDLSQTAIEQCFIEYSREVPDIDNNGCRLECAHEDEGVARKILAIEYEVDGTGVGKKLPIDLFINVKCPPFQWKLIFLLDGLHLLEVYGDKIYDEVIS